MKNKYIYFENNLQACDLGREYVLSSSGRVVHKKCRWPEGVIRSQLTYTHTELRIGMKERYTKKNVM